MWAWRPGGTSNTPCMLPPTSQQSVSGRCWTSWRQLGPKRTLTSRSFLNAPVGLWSTQEQYLYSVRTSQRAEDCLGYHMKRLVSYGEDQHITDYIFATRLVGNSSWRPIWDYVLATEHMRVAQMRWVTERLGVPPRAVRQIKTDCLVLQPAKKLIPKLMAMGEIRHCDLPDLVQTRGAKEAG